MLYQWSVGILWRNVPSNTKVKLFLKFLNAVKSFEYNNHFPINDLDPEKNCSLKYIADPLQEITHHLKNQVNCLSSHALNIRLNNRCWEIDLKDTTVKSKNVILATGSESKNLSHENIETIPLSLAMDKEALKKHIGNDDTFAVFGSSHSAILTLRNLIENEVKQVINFYRSPLRYAVYLDNWILFDDTGLKGPTADWARNYIDGHQPKNLSRYYANNKSIQSFLPQCNKVVYAVGFQRRSLPTIENMADIEYIEQCGIIAPGLFGLGIAFPEVKINPIGVTEHRVGLWKFMDYLQRVMPIWLNYPV